MTRFAQASTLNLTAIRERRRIANATVLIASAVSNVSIVQNFKNMSDVAKAYQASSADVDALVDEVVQLTAEKNALVRVLAETTGADESVILDAIIRKRSAA